MSALAHLGVVAALIWPRAVAPPPDVSSVLIDLVEFRASQPPGPPPAAAHTPADIPQNTAPPTPARTPASAPVRDAVSAPQQNTSDLLSDIQIAGAATIGNEQGGGGAGGGLGGGGCDTARFLQQALQRDPLVRSAVEKADRAGKAIMLWDGDWVRSGAQDGKGLAVVRQAVVWELAFAPEACRNARMHGLVLLSLADGTTRFAIGADDWRWSDLLGLPGTASAR